MDILFYLRSNGQYIVVGETTMAFFFVDYDTVRTSDRKVCSFLLKVRWTTYFS